MYVESLELSKLRAELIAGGFNEEEAFNLTATYFEAKLDARIAEEGFAYLVNEQFDLDGPEDG